jgi:hypothetical protein
MNSLGRIHFQPVILSREDGEGSLTISAATQHREEMITDSSTPLRSAQNDSF